MTSRQERREVWDDENLVPFSTAATIAMRETGADPDLVAAWRDHNQGMDPGDWHTYSTWLKGELQVSLEQGQGTLMACSDWVQHYEWPVKLWQEMSKYTTEHYNDQGQSATELEMIAKRNAERFQEAVERAEANMPSAVTESIIDLPGELYVRYDPQTETFLGFGFTPINDSHPGFSHLDGPEPGCDLTEYDNPVWRGLREYLANVTEISGETAFEVQWTEDGWRVK